MFVVRRDADSELGGWAEAYVLVVFGPELDCHVVLWARAMVRDGV